MAFVPPLFKDLGKAANDLLTKKFKFENKITNISKINQSLTIESSFSDPTENPSGAVKIKGKQADYGKFEGEFKTKGEGSVEFKFDKAVEGAVFIVGAKHNPSVQLGVEYRRENVSAVANVSAESLSKAKITLGAVAGSNGASVGGGAELDQNGGLTDYSAAAEYTQDKTFTATLKVLEKLGKVNASYLHYVNKDLTVVASADVPVKDWKSSSLTLGGQFQYNAATLVQARVNSAGVFGTAVEYNLPASNFKIAVAAQQKLNQAASTSRNYGLAVTYGQE